MNWFKKVGISNALDHEGRSAASECPPTRGSTELELFRRKVSALDAALRSDDHLSVEIPDGLHESIMRAVRSAKSSQSQSNRELAIVVLFRERWIAAAALCAVALICSWYFLRPGPKPPSSAENLAAATTPLLSIEQVARSAPAAVTAPLSTELDRVQNDLEATARFLLASVP